MGRVIAIGPGGKAQAPARDDRYRAVIEWVLANDMLGQPLLVPARFTPTWAEADDVRRALYRSVFYFCSCGKANCTRKHRNYENGCPAEGQRVSCRADVVKDPQGHLRVQFCLRDKREAMRYVIERYGPDINHWPWNPRAKKLKDDGR